MRGPMEESSQHDGRLPPGEVPCPLRLPSPAASVSQLTARRGERRDIGDAFALIAVGHAGERGGAAGEDGAEADHRRGRFNHRHSGRMGRDGSN